MFDDRIQAGQKLAEKLLSEISPKEFKTVVLAVPRGGVIVGGQIAEKISCPLDIIVTRKIGAPGQPELAIGAVGETDGSKYLNEHLEKELGINSQYLGEEINKQKQEIKRRESLYRQNKKPLDLRDKLVIIADDGAATGATLIAAAREVWNNNPGKIIIALPVVPMDTVLKLEKEADEVVVLETPEPFFSVGQFYQQFPQVTDEEVINVLKCYSRESGNL